MRALVVADLRQWTRDPRAMLVSLVVPLALLVVAALAGTVGTGYTVAVVDDQPADVRAALAASPYLRVRLMGRAEAAAAVAAGEVAGSYDTRDGVLVVHVAPYGNDDVRRNLVMRQQAVLAEVNAARLAAAGTPHLVVRERGLLPATVSDQAYLAAGIVVFTALFTGVTSTAYATARELETGTMQHLLVCPLPVGRVLAAKVVTGTVQAAVAVAVALTVVVAGFGVRVAGPPWLLAGVLLAAAVGSAGAGVALGAGLGRTVPAVLAGVVGSLVTWFVGGGFAPVTLQPTALRAVAWALPPTYAVSAGQRCVNGLGTSGADVLVTVVAAALTLGGGLAAAARLLRSGRVAP